MSGGWLPGIHTPPYGNIVSNLPRAVQFPLTHVLSVADDDSGRIVSSLITVDEDGDVRTDLTGTIRLLPGFDPLIQWSAAIGYAQEALE